MANERFVLMNPGPVMTDARVRAALAGRDLCHRDTEFSDLLERVRTKVTTVAQGHGKCASVVLTGSGTAAIEAALTSIVGAGRRLLVVQNGHYGQRLCDIARAHGLEVVSVQADYGHVIDPAMVDAALSDDPSIECMALVHHETSTGMLNDVGGLCALAHEHSVETIVDGVSSIGAETIDMGNGAIDWLMGSSGKAIEGPPGLSFVCGSRSGFEQLAGKRPAAFYLDLSRHYAAQEVDHYPAFTPSVPLFYGFEVALDLLIEEGVASRHRRYWVLADRVRSSLCAAGLVPFIPAEVSSVCLSAFQLPRGVSYQHLSDELRAAGFIIYGAQDHLRDHYFRVSTMGQMSSEDISHFESVIASMSQRDGWRDD